MKKVSSKIFLTFLCIYGIQPIHLFSQSAHTLMRNGDRLYGLGKWNDAEMEYRKAKEEESTLKSDFNLGNTLMHQDRPQEAIEQYTSAINSKGSDAQKSEAYYNLGNAYFSDKKYKESIDAYKNALKLHPDDVQTKENLAIAKRQLKIQQQEQQQQQQQQKSDQNKDQNEDKQDQQNQNDKNDKSKDEENKNNQNSDSNSSSDAQKNQKNDASKNKMTKEEAEKFLQIIENEEQKVQEKLRRGTNNKPAKKNW
ncbi:MAG: tetratricopeptide repeat protein [Saprospiraceae bacterium]|nr:tetratricopeptide repeat protein [Saprospiraceae bacterium]